MNYYRHHIGDYLRDTAHLSLIEDALYRRLLDLYYMRERPLANDIPAICRLIRAQGDDDAVKAILVEFFVLCDDGWRQKRADFEIAEANEAADRARENGKRGGRPKKTQPVISGLSVETQPVISGLAKHNPEESSHPPSPIPHPPTNTPNGVCRFAPPTPEDVYRYAGEAGILIDGRKFCDFYESKGWKVGKTPMKDWKAAVRNWGRNSDNKPAGEVRVWK